MAMEALQTYLARSNTKPITLAAALNVEPSTVTRILKGDRKPSVDLARRIAAITGLSMSDLRPDIFEPVPAPASPEAA